MVSTTPARPWSALLRPERVTPRLSEPERFQRMLVAPWAARLSGGKGIDDDFIRRVHAHAKSLPPAHAACREEVVSQLLEKGFEADVVARTFAWIRALSGQVLGMAHHDVQLMGGWVMLRGFLAEMATGEGKTLTATLPAATAALAGVKVYVLTVNDYLAQRDQEEMAPLYHALGLKSAAALQDMDEAERTDACQAPITYCTAKTLVFDYLRDHIELGQSGETPSRRCLNRLVTGRMPRVRLKGLHFALVDEADSILIDEARTPLVISGTPDEASCHEDMQACHQAIDLASTLKKDEEFEFTDARTLRLTPAGRKRVDQATFSSAGWTGLERKSVLVTQALTALHVFRRDVDYLVRDDSIQIIDAQTGRVMPDRQWQQGLHQLIEIKEGLRPSPPNLTQAQISYQRFFRRFFHLCGMSGTVREVAPELWRVYGLKVWRVPTHRPVRRTILAPRVWADAESKWAAVVAEVRKIRQTAASVLIGTASVKDSEAISAALEQAGMPHQVLNARQDAQEADIVAQAGQPGSITVSTQLAGRGTDIRLAPEVREAGGLHVILTSCQSSARIDRQLEGRCARQGDPGVAAYRVSWEDGPLQELGSVRLIKLCRQFANMGLLPARVSLALMRLLQKQGERKAARERARIEKEDEKLQDMLAFAGEGE